MSVEFFQKEIESKEKKLNKLFAGYISPDGDLIDYNNDSRDHDNCHDEWTKGPSLMFLEYMSYLVDGKNFIHRGHDILYKEDNEDYETFKKSIKEKIKEYEDISEKTPDEKFVLDILYFFNNAYAHDDFFKCIQNTIRIQNPKWIEREVRRKYKDYPKDYQDEKVKRNIKKQMLTHFKDICVTYLGYDSLERISPEGRFVDIHKDHYNFISNPRTITSSSRNINDRFYNYLLMDWQVYKLPKYKYNEETGLYEPQNGILANYITEKEDSLHEEIESIKKLVPINERYRYFKE